MNVRPVFCFVHVVCSRVLFSAWSTTTGRCGSSAEVNYSAFSSPPDGVAMVVAEFGSVELTRFID